jgi:CrcB protein
MSGIGERAADEEPIDPDVAESRPRSGRVHPRILGAVALGGALGASARYELALHVRSAPSGFPLSTFVINVTGSFVIGVLMTLIMERWPPTTYVRPFAVTGILGGYTTWSTFMVDTDLLIKSGHIAVAVGYVAATVVAGFTATYLGILVARRRPGRAR